MNNQEEKIEVEEFRDLIKDMFRGYPNYIYSEDMVKKVIKNEVRMGDLLKNKILIEERHDDGERGIRSLYSLGVNALPLVSAWKNEEYAKETKNFTKNIKCLTTWLIILTIVLIVLTGLMTYKMIYP